MKKFKITLKCGKVLNVVAKNISDCLQYIPEELKANFEFTIKRVGW